MDGVYEFLHVDQVAFTIVETILIDVVADLAEWCPGDSAVHVDPVPEAFEPDLACGVVCFSSAVKLPVEF